MTSIGEHVVTTLTEVFWYLDPFHERMMERGNPVPSALCGFQGYADWKAQKKKKPVVCAWL